MTLSREGGSKDIVAATLAQFQAVAQLCYAQREVTDSDISLGDIGEGCTQLPLVHGCHIVDDKRAAREIVNETVADKQVAIGGKLVDIESIGNGFKATGLHDGGIRLVEELRGKM